MLRQLFQDSMIIVPFRDPLEQAISLYRQHQRFIIEHKIDAFSYRYMKDIGHFEFGLLHKPIAFKSFSYYQNRYSPNDTDYWLAYWVCAFDEILTNKQIKLVSFEAICSGGRSGIAKLFAELEMALKGDELDNGAALLNSAPPERNQDFNFSQSLKFQAYDIHAKMMQLCILN